MTRPESARGALNPFGMLAERLALIDDTVTVLLHCCCDGGR